MEHFSGLHASACVRQEFTFCLFVAESCGVFSTFGGSFDASSRVERDRVGELVRSVCSDGKTCIFFHS